MRRYLDMNVVNGLRQRHDAVGLDDVTLQLKSEAVPNRRTLSIPKTWFVIVLFIGSTSVSLNPLNLPNAADPV